jgi:hypothetical protein
MASGSTVSSAGMTTMTQVVAGDVIDDADFNNARTNVNKLLGGSQDVQLSAGSSFTYSTAYGLSQGGAGVNSVAAGNTVYRSSASQGFKDLQDDVQALCAFYGQSLRTGVGSDVTTSTTIAASTWSNLMLNIQDCWDNRFTPSSRTISTDASKTYTSSWTNTLTQETTWTFASEGACRAFFNGGGRLGYSASYTGSSGDQFDAHAARLSGMGDFYMDYSTSGASAGSASGIGFYELATSYQTLWTYYGASAPYSNDYVQTSAKVNSVTNPTVVTLRIQLVDATDNVIDASATGTLTINARRHAPDANGSGFSFTQPTDSMGNITGS